VNRHALISALVLTAFAVGATTHAQDEAAGLAQAQRLIKAASLEDLGVKTLKATTARLRAQSVGKDPKLERVIVALKEQAKPQELSKRLAKIYAKHLDAKTLEALLAFYATPAGQAVADKQSALFADVKQATDDWLQAAFRRALKSQGIPTQEENLKQARRHGNEAAAIGAMRTCGSAQSLYREGDKDGNGELDYAPNLAALGKTQLIDSVLASGTKQGYLFELCRGSKAPQFTWMMIASPIKPGVSGDRYFATNHTGVTFYRTDKPFELDRESCKVTGGKPVGR
jgi:hypothetical protein